MMRYGADFLQRHSHMSVIDFKKTSPASVTKCGNASIWTVYYWPKSALLGFECIQ